jgi:chromosome segregation and condensation protein ScpB
MLTTNSENTLKYLIDYKLTNQPINNVTITQIYPISLEDSLEIVAELIAYGLVNGEVLKNKSIIYSVTDNGLNYFEQANTAFDIQNLAFQN